MTRPRNSGTYFQFSAAGEHVDAFVPSPLPPNPPIEWTPALRRNFDNALLTLGRLDALSSHLPNALLLLYSFVRKEAVLSSHIEGTQSSLADLLLFEAEEQPGAPLDDTREVSRCVAALDRGLELLQDGLPMSIRLILEMHAALMAHPRGIGKTPGEFRRSQVWIGGSRPGNAAFVPPPAQVLPDCMRDFERFLNDEPEVTPPLIKAALAHVQFETIHPFLDGNGRIGRLLIVLQLVADGLLKQPMIYPSLYFKKEQARYYELLNQVRIHGDWEAWLEFFAEGVSACANDAISAITRLLDAARIHRDSINSLGRASASALKIHESLQRRPIASSNMLVALTALTPATVNKSLKHLQELGIVDELTARKRGRVFAYSEYMQLLMSDG